MQLTQFARIGCSRDRKGYQYKDFDCLQALAVGFHSQPWRLCLKTDHFQTDRL